MMATSAGFEPATAGLEGQCSSAELRGLSFQILLNLSKKRQYLTAIDKNLKITNI